MLERALGLAFADIEDTVAAAAAVVVDMMELGEVPGLGAAVEAVV